MLSHHWNPAPQLRSNPGWAAQPRDGHLSPEEDLLVCTGGRWEPGRGGSSQDMQSFPLWGIGAKYAQAEDEVVTYRVSQFNQIGKSPTLPRIVPQNVQCQPSNLNSNLNYDISSLSI